MGYSAGTYTLPTSVNPVVSGTTITTNWATTTLNDIATALSTCLLKDGTQTATASVPLVQGASIGGSFVVNNAGTITGTSTSTQTISGPISIAGASAGQITFPASQNASSNANTLDDYEEGSWTPVFRGSATAGTQTYGTQFGRYTRIGRTVLARCVIVMTAKDAATAGNLQVGGLPYSAANDASSNGGCGPGYYANLDLDVGGGYYQLGATVSAASTTASLFESGDNVAQATLTEADLAATSAISITIIYDTDT